MVVRDPNAVAYGVDPGKIIRTERLALQLQAALTRNLSENVSINAKYLLYANHQTLDAIDTVSTYYLRPKSANTSARRLA